MAEKSLTSSPTRSFGLGTILTWLFGLVCFGVLVFLIVEEAISFTTPAALHRLQLVQDVALPPIVKTPNNQPPIKSIRSDHFDFQTLDPRAGLLFMAHSGPTQAKLAILQEILPAGTQINGTIVVFDTIHNKYITSIPIPNIHGIVVAPDLGRVYAANGVDNQIYVIDEHTFQMITTIKLAASPDALDYDPVDHKVFVSQPGDPADRKTQNEIVIDAITNKVINTIPLGVDGKFGDDVGHTHYDATLNRIFVVVQPLPDPNNPNAVVQPPSYLTVINPVSDQVLTRVRLSDECINPHGMVIDSQQQVAFVACVDSQNVTLVDLQSLKAIGATPSHSLGTKPDIVALDESLHILYVGSNTALSVFDESQAASAVLKKLGRPTDYIISSNSSHTVAVDENTHYIYVPLTDVGGQPVLRILQFDPRGTV